jgi:hypothetical protein
VDDWLVRNLMPQNADHKMAQLSSQRPLGER